MLRNSIVEACWRGDLEQLEAEYAERGAQTPNWMSHNRDWSGHSRKGWSPLEAASDRGHLHIVQWLVETVRVDIDASDGYGWTPFHIACLNDRLDVAQYLYKSGANVRPQDCGCWTPFHLACRHGCLRSVRWLVLSVNIGGDVEMPARQSDTTPLVLARKSGNGALVQWLESFIRRRALIAHWSVGRARDRSSLPPLGATATATVWRLLPREAMARVLLLLAPA